MSDRRGADPPAADRDPGESEIVPACFVDAPPSQGAVPPAFGVAAARRVLRGRYRWAVGIAAVLAAAGAVAGATLPQPLYRSVGLIDVAPKVPRVLYESDEKGLLPMFDAYVASQAALASTRRIVDMAMASPEWRKFGRAPSDEEIAKFQEQLAVTHPKFTEHVEVAFVDPDPDAAMTAVNEVIKAYMKIVGERDDVSGATVRRALETQRAVANNRLSELRASVLAATDDLGEPALEARYQAGIDELNRLDGVLHQLDTDIATARAANDSGVLPPPQVLTEQEIALRDDGVDRLLAERADAENRVRRLVTQDKLGVLHPDVVAARQALESVSRRAADRVAAFRETAGREPGARLDVVEAVARRARLAELRERVQEETRSLGKKRVLIDNLAQERTLQTESLDEVKRRLEQIDVESGVHGRISVVAYGDRPVEAETDRRVPLSILGVGAGLALGFGLVLLWGVREASLRYVVDASGAAAQGRFLGVVPDVTERPVPGTDVAPAEMSDFCVHHIRTMLQLRAGRRQAVVALTSPSPGAGKTTVTLALGASFAASGARTLVVDCDFTGHGLTSTLHSIVCEAAVLAVAGAGTDGDGRAEPAAGRRIVPTLVEARLRPHADVLVDELIRTSRALSDAGDRSFADTARALDALARCRGVPDPEPHARRGVAGVLSGRPLADCVVGTGVPHLSVLPVGDSRPESADRLSGQAVARLVAACRAEYDVVLIDSGPLLGSIEALYTTTAADAVVVVVARGDRRPLLDDTLARLDHIGADVAGVVFNRAAIADVARSSYASRSTSKAAVT